MRTHAGRYKLTWLERSGRWRKRYKGKTYYFPAHNGEGKINSYPRVREAWLKKKAEIDRDAFDDDSPDAMVWRSMIGRVTDKLLSMPSEDSPANREHWKFWFAQLQTYQRMLNEGIGYFGENEDDSIDPKDVPLVIGGGDDVGPAPWDEFTLQDDVANPRSVNGYVQQFLRQKQDEAQRGELSNGRYDVLRLCLDNFADHAGRYRPIHAVTGNVLATYKDKLQSSVDRKEISHHYARDRLQVAKQFVQWAADRDFIDPPRILGRKDFTISLPERRIETFSKEEVHALLDASPERTRLYLLLMLNCGMTQGDISELRTDEIDWKARRINRKRSKTAKHENVPEVSYKLWPETFQLLKKHRSKGDVALTNRNGTPLKSEEIVNGKVAKTDNIRSAFNRVVRKLGIANVDQKPLKLLRKTAATMLGEHSEYSRYAQHYLGHAPGTIADKHYVRPSTEQFDKATEWLRTWLGIAKDVGGDSDARN